MGITYSAEKKQEWENFKTKGGMIKFEIDSTDISSTKEFETFPSIQPNLKTGFEIPPTTLIHSPELQALIQTGGSEWDYILCRIYLAGGKVTYRKLDGEKYEALCTVDIAPHSEG
ncbi:MULTISPECIES: hypothetical protein [Pseudomonas]|uniref:Phage tail protein n=1 Tax=Pseudomonas quercus TaxID=2722792 RepID=A0ABX0YF57_9PSED|nr:MULTISPECIES: hypothetical protein [Pseudomonas]MBF7143266.1 hypothetical protein [Pseudomonas sp. LY10J]NJP01570.1 hypothetical protein [Pseudomonas quercus]